MDHCYTGCPGSSYFFVLCDNKGWKISKYPGAKQQMNVVVCSMSIQAVSFQMEKNIFAKSLATQYVPEALLICFSNNTALSSNCKGTTAWFRLWYTTIVFCRCQTGYSNEDVIGGTTTLYPFML